MALFKKKTSRCRSCVHYDELIDGIKLPCDEDIPDDTHFCDKYGYDKIPTNVWKGKKDCPYYEKSATNDNLL